MSEADSADNIGANARTRPDFVQQASLIQIQVRVVGEWHDRVRGNVVSAQRGGLPVPHEFGKKVRHEARTGVESPIERVADRQVVDVRRIDGDIAAETRAQEQRKRVFRLEAVEPCGVWISRWRVALRWVAFGWRVTVGRIPSLRV